MMWYLQCLLFFPIYIYSSLISTKRQHSSDSECSSASENSDDEIPWKRSKIHNKHRHITTSECSEFIAQAQHFSEQRKSSLDSPAENSMGYRKPNCVWNNVLEEQGLVENLTSFGVHTTVLDSDRGCEGYHYSPKFKDKPIRQNYSSKMNGQFRGKRNFKDRHNQLPRMRREPPSLGVDENDSEEKVINAIATILREPKQDLIGGLCFHLR